jgi:outer membrane protein assembly factor BamB
MARTHTRWLAIVAMVALLIPIAWIARSALANGTTTLTLSPTSGVAGITVSAGGSGFGHKEPVSVTFDTTPVATATANISGYFSTSFAVPQGALVGNHTVTATGQKTGRAASATFQVVSAPAATDWLQFGWSFAGGRSNPSETSLSASNVAQLTQDWTAALNGGGGVPGAVVYNGTVYADDGTGIDALDAASGKLLWFGSTMGSGSTASSHITPAVSNGAVYAGGGDNRVYAFDAATGASRWIFAPNAQMLSSPAVASGVVYITTRDGHIYALDGTSGSVIWSFLGSLSDPIDQTPAVANGAVYFISERGIAYALNASTGAQLWQTSIGSPGEGVDVPAVDNGMVFMISGAPSPSTQGEVVALDSTTGATKWTAYTPFYGTNGLALANGVIYVSTISNGVYAFDEATGALKWQAQVAMAESAPAVANGVVYVGAGTAYVYAFDAATGATLATIGNCGTQPYSSPVVAHGTVYIGCGTILGAFHLPGATP